MHDVGVALRGDQALRLLALAARVDHGMMRGLGRADRVLRPVEVALEAEAILAPQAVDDGQPLGGARVAVVVLVELQAVLRRLVGPPGGDDVEREAAVRDPVDVRRRLGEERGLVEVGADGDHQFDRFGHRGERGGGRPGVERGALDALDVVEVELGNEGEVVAPGFRVLRQLLRVGPARLHPLVGDVAQPAAEDGSPIAVAHQRCSSIRPVR